MAAPDTTLIDQKIEQEIYTDTSVSGAKPNALSFRRTYKAVTKWVGEQIVNASPWRRLADGKGSTDENDTVYHPGRTIIGRAQDDGSGMALQSTGISADQARLGKTMVSMVNGLAINRQVMVSPEGGKPAVRYFKIATLLQDDNAGLLDTLRLLAVVGGWGSQQRASIDLTVANRAGLTPYTIINGEPQGCGFAVYRRTDGYATLYLRLPNNFYCASITIVQCHQTVVLDSWAEEILSDTYTLVYDSTDTLAYPPALTLGGNSAVRGYLRTGYGNKGFQITSTKSGSGLNVKTDQYLELRLDDGSVLKVAILN